MPLALLTIPDQSAERQKTEDPVGGNVSRPRAADDFPAIRARLEELQRERSAEPAPDDRRWPDRPRPYAVGSSGGRARRLVCRRSCAGCLESGVDAPKLR